MFGKLNSRVVSHELQTTEALTLLVLLGVGKDLGECLAAHCEAEKMRQFAWLRPWKSGVAMVGLNIGAAGCAVNGRFWDIDNRDPEEFIATTKAQVRLVQAEVDFR